jgi:hypothetical protein
MRMGIPLWTFEEQQTNRRLLFFKGSMPSLFVAIAPQ